MLTSPGTLDRTQTVISVWGTRAKQASRQPAQIRAFRTPVTCTLTNKKILKMHQ